MITPELQTAFLAGIRNAETGSFKNPDDVVSDAGAISAMQVLPSTALDPGLRGVTPLNPEDLTDMSKVAAFGDQYALALLDRYDGDVEKAAGAYVRGFGAEDEEKSLGPRSANYVNKVNQFVKDRVSQPEEDREVPTRLSSTSYLTKNFQDVVNAFPANMEATDENITNHAIKNGIDPDSYKEELIKAQEELDAGGDLIPDRTAVGRVAGRAIGETFEGVTDFAGMLGRSLGAGNLVESVSNAAEFVAENVPPEVAELFRSTFDPAHPEDIGGSIEYVAGHVGSFLIPGTGVVKGINLAQKGMKGSPFLTKIDDAIEKGLATKLAPQTAKRVKKIAGTTAKYELGFAGAATMVEDPKENFVNILVKEFPETFDFMQSLATNPKDSESQQYLQAFLNNIGLGVVTGPVFASPALISAFRNAGAPSVSKIAKTAARMENSALGKVVTPLKQLGQKLKGRLYSRMGTNDELLASIIRMEQAGPAALTVAKGTNRDLKQAAKKDFGKAFNDEQTIITMNKALGGDKATLRQLQTQAPNVLRSLETMRNDIDDLSKAVSANLPDNEFKLIIDDNYNSYVNRSYRAFDDPNWKGYKEFDTDEGRKIKESAEAALVKMGFTKGEDTEQVMEWIAKGMPKSKVQDVIALNKKNRKKIDNFMQVLTDYSSLKGSSPVVRRQKIAEPFRQLMGEVKNPYTNYANTFEKLSIIKAEQDYLKEVIENLRKYEMATTAKSPGLVDGTGYVPFKTDILEARLNRLGGSVQPVKKTGAREPESRVKQLSAPFEEVAKKEFGFPLENLYVNPVYAEAIVNGTEILAPTSKLMRTWVAGKAASQIMKTVASPATHGRNVMGNIIIMLSNGMLPIGKKGEMTAFVKRMGNLEDRELAKRIAEAQRVGVIDSGVKAGTVKGQMKDVGTNPRGYLDKVLDKTAITRGGKKASKKVFQLYQDEDNFFKFLHYNKSKDELQKAFPEKSIDEIIERAAQETRDLMPNYNLVSKSLKSLRRAPVGDFLSFPSEMMRVTKNLGKYTLNDIRSGNPVLIKRGMRRLGGMTAAGLGTDIAMRYSMNMFGITEQEADDLNQVVPVYEKDVPKLFLSPIYKDKNDKNVIEYVNFGPIDPFDYIKFTGRAVHNALLTDREVNWNEFVARVAAKQLSPFFGASMVTKGLLEAVTGVTDLDPNRPEKELVASFENIIDPFTPGFVPALKRLNQYYTSLEELNENRKGKGPIGPYGQSLGDGDSSLWPQLAGVRVQLFDIDNAMARNVGLAQRDVKRSKNEFTDKPAYRDYGISRPQELVDDYVESQEIKYERMRKLREIIKPFLKLTPNGKTLTYAELEDILTKQERFALKDISLLNQALENTFIPDELTESNLKYLLKSGKIKSMDDPAILEIYRFMQQIDGLSLED